jgi:hypothetical protein
MSGPMTKPKTTTPKPRRRTKSDAAVLDALKAAPVSREKLSPFAKAVILVTREERRPPARRRAS